MLILLVEREWLLVRFCASHGCLLVLDATLFVLPEDASIERLRRRLGNLVGLKVHLDIAVLFGLFLLGLVLQPRTSDRLLVRAATLAHAKRLRHRDVVLALTSFGDHVLLIDQLLFK